MQVKFGEKKWFWMVVKEGEAEVKGSKRNNRESARLKHFGLSMIFVALYNFFLFEICLIKEIC